MNAPFIAPSDDFGEYPWTTPEDTWNPSEEWDPATDDLVECQCGERILFADAIPGEDALGRVWFGPCCEPQPCLNLMAWEASGRGDR